MNSFVREFQRTKFTKFKKKIKKKMQHLAEDSTLVSEMNRAATGQAGTWQASCPAVFWKR